MTTGPRSNDRPLRIGIVCPYSLTLPGGVQAQVMGLARELRRQGHEARVLGPCDGPPPEAFVTPLGNSLPTAANGSIAPLAPDASAALRTIRALRDEEFDVVHVHEPIVPGPPMTTVTMRPAPIVGTFHAAGDSASYKIFRPVVLWLFGRIDRKVVVSKDAMELAQSALGGEYEMLFNGVEDRASSGRPHRRRPTARRSSSAGATRSARVSTCCSRRSRPCPPTTRLWIASDGPDTAAACRRATPTTRGSNGSGGSATRRRSPA